MAEFITEGIPDLPNMEEGLPAAPQMPPQPLNRPFPTSNGIPMFFHQSRRRDDGTFELIECVEIKTPGDNKSISAHKVTDYLRQKYAEHYRAWREGIEGTSQGTPIDSWPVIDKGTSAACKAINILSVEMLAETPDSNLHRIPMGRTLKNRAVEWLKVKEEADRVDELARQKEAMADGMKVMEDQNIDLQKKLSDSTGTIEKMMARIDALEKEALQNKNIVDKPIKPTKKE